MPWSQVRDQWTYYRIETNTLYLLYRFTETEVLAVLTLMISKYKITIKDEPQFASETFEERKKRVLRAKNLLTLTYVYPWIFHDHH